MKFEEFVIFSMQICDIKKSDVDECTHVAAYKLRERQLFNKPAASNKKSLYENTLPSD